ncbi:MAG: segregation/condensation protein A [Nitrospirae bacterium]|nr:MAG: segregation/condensation protein A [Nitrospirota bacterium]
MTERVETGLDSFEASYLIRLEQFEGPLDLLLHLIKKNEINIYDIPMALVTKQYLEHINLMKSLNLVVAGEFLVLAATLIHIKSKMLLPSEPDGEEEEGQDPRAELVRQLLQYKQFKEAAYDLQDRERLWREVYRRAPLLSATPRESEETPLELTLFDLMDALQDVVRRAPSKALLELTTDHWTVKDRMNYILERLEESAAVPFDMLFLPADGRLVLIVTFLGLLELMRLKLVRVFQPETFGAILLSRAFLPELVDAMQPGEDQL